ncbi:MAG: pyridoxal-phosphate dependent enzyme [Phycisphaeraceae bacterium]|nr:pyridoxal-phosphate dependent enzyme [Phycisphaerales bacterium]QOJ17811.1 MAG: pyridoxal-phosphate dependent enzyme [Phycisphaeraceae bacterium]
MPATSVTPPAAPTFPPPNAVYAGVLDMIGRTPMVQVRHIDTGPCTLFLKLESLNPGNSIKDRIAVSMIAQAEQDGLLKPGGHLVEATAGNTGIALALVASQKGYQVTVVMPDKMSDEKISHLRAMGAKVVLTRSDVNKGHPEYYQDIAQRIARETGAFYVNQFGNAANPRAHYTTTGPEIWEQMEGRIDAFVAGVGSGGTVSGCGRFLRERHPAIDIVLADPEGSVLAPLVNEGRAVEAGSWLVEGIGEDFVPDILDLQLVNKAYTIPDREAFLVARELLRKEGVLAGSSTGTLVGAALRYCREQRQPRRVVTFVCDNGSKYLSKMFNDFWMMDQGFIERRTYGDLRDLIARRHTERQDYTLKPATPVGQAFKQMRLYDISQMVVLDEHDAVVGIIDESDVLLAVTHDMASFRRPVSDFMTRRLETIRPTASVNDLIPIFRADRVAIVADESGFHGIITKVDLINYLRKQLP